MSDARPDMLHKWGTSQFVSEVKPPVVCGVLGKYSPIIRVLTV